MRPRIGPWLLLALALLTPAVVWAWLEVGSPDIAPPATDAGLLHPAVLASQAEDRSVGPADWLRLAVRKPEAFQRTVNWCRLHSSDPLPNCRNVELAALVVTSTPPGVDHAD